MLSLSQRRVLALLSDCPRMSAGSGGRHREKTTPTLAALHVALCRQMVCIGVHSYTLVHIPASAPDAWAAIVAPP